MRLSARSFGDSGNGLHDLPAQDPATDPVRRLWQRSCGACRLPPRTAMPPTPLRVWPTPKNMKSQPNTASQPTSVPHQSEIRMSNSETNSKFRSSAVTCSVLEFWICALDALDLFRISCFGFRISTPRWRVAYAVEKHLRLPDPRRPDDAGRDACHARTPGRPKPAPTSPKRQNF